MKEIQFSEFGKPEDVVRVVSADNSSVLEGQVAVRMVATPVNPADINFIEGTYGVKPELPAVPGIEGVGIVEESRAEGLSVGDKVIFLAAVGTWRELVVCDASSVMVIPAGVDSLQAAMLKVNPMTALCLLQNYKTLSSGDWVIQNAANSGVGQCVIQVAKALGLRTINLVRREELIPQLKALGADHVLLDSAENKEAIVQLCRELKPSLACNAVGGDSSIRLMGGLVEQGAHVTYGAMSRRPVTIPNKYLIFKRIRFEGLWITKWLEETARAEVEEKYCQLAKWIQSGQLKQNIENVLSIEEVVSALTRAQESGRDGKILLSFDT